jgi:DNA mismatch repair protein MutL
METIKVLDRATIDKIAAGEVVERPSSVVKELLENAIDAGSGAVTVEIREGGKSLIRVTDNGGGISSDELPLAFTRHATSKIRNIGDLVTIESLGFRGEALSSIAAVSRVEMITKTPDALTGTRYCIEGGVEQSNEEVGAPPGTTILVRDLFYNTPARAKFLRSAAAEGSRCAAVIEEIALSHPDISFKFLMNGKSGLFTSGNGNLKEIIYQIFGREIAGKLIPVSYEGRLCSLHGFLASPEIARGSRGFENYFVNGRFVKNRTITRAIEDGYHGHLMQHRFPFTLLYLNIHADMVDVNVHPAKMEVRLSEEENLYHEITLAIQNALMERERIPEISFRNNSGREKSAPVLPHLSGSLPEPFENRRRASEIHSSVRFASADTRQNPVAGSQMKAGAMQSENGDRPAGANFAPKGDAAADAARIHTSEHAAKAVADAGAAYNAPGQASEPSGIASGQSNREKLKGMQTELFSTPMLSKEARPKHRIIGQLFDTYWLIEYDDTLYIIDQHAAHEKVLYERLMKQYREKKIHSQMLLPAPVVTLTLGEVQVLKQNMSSFEALGYEIEPFGGNSYRINGVPDRLYRIDPAQLFTEMLDALSEIGGKSDQLILERIASMSCKAAVKGNHRLTMQEADALIDELLTLENPYHCPHGRPTIVKMTHTELDRKFHRIV